MIILVGVLVICLIAGIWGWFNVNRKNDGKALNNSNKVSQSTKKEQGISHEDVVEQTELDLIKPHGPADIEYSVTESADKTVVVQMDFKTAGKQYYLRSVATDMTSLYDDMGDVYLGVNISGMNCDWDEQFYCMVGDVEGVGFINKAETAGFLAWLDSEKGILYNLCMPEKAGVQDLTEYADSCFSYALGSSTEESN